MFKCTHVPFLFGDFAVVVSVGRLQQQLDWPVSLHLPITLQKDQVSEFCVCTTQQSAIEGAMQSPLKRDATIMQFSHQRN